MVSAEPTEEPWMCFPPSFPPVSHRSLSLLVGSPRQHGVVRGPPEPSLPLAQARARWGGDVVVAGLFRPGPNPRARTALTRAVSRRSNRRQSEMPTRVLLAVDDGGRALLCTVSADPQGGHPTGEDLYAGPFEELGAVAAGSRSLVLLLDATRPVVLEPVWLDHDAATIAALLSGEPLPEEHDPRDDRPDDGEEDDERPYPDALLAAAEAAQARADSLRALAAAAVEEEAAEKGPPA